MSVYSNLTVGYTDSYSTSVTNDKAAFVDILSMLAQKKKKRPLKEVIKLFSSSSVKGSSYSVLTSMLKGLTLSISGLK